MGGLLHCPSKAGVLRSSEDTFGHVAQQLSPRCARSCAARSTPTRTATRHSAPFARLVTATEQNGRTVSQSQLEFVELEHGTRGEEGGGFSKTSATSYSRVARPANAKCRAAGTQRSYVLPPRLCTRHCTLWVTCPICLPNLGLVPVSVGELGGKEKEDFSPEQEPHTCFPPPHSFSTRPTCTLSVLRTHMPSRGQIKLLGQELNNTSKRGTSVHFISRRPSDSASTQCGRPRASC